MIRVPCQQDRLLLYVANYSTSDKPFRQDCLYKNEVYASLHHTIYTTVKYAQTVFIPVHLIVCVLPSYFIHTFSHKFSVHIRTATEFEILFECHTISCNCYISVFLTLSVWQSLSVLLTSSLSNLFCNNENGFPCTSTESGCLSYFHCLSWRPWWWYL